MLKTLLKPTLIACLALSSPAFGDDHDSGFGAAGVLSGKNKEDLPPLTLSSGMPISEGPWVLKSGTYYEFEIIGDGSQELALTGPEFFRSIWIDEIVVEGLEIRPLGLDSVRRSGRNGDRVLGDQAGTLLYESTRQHG